MADLAGSPMSSICAEYESKFYDNLGISYLKLLMFSAVTCLAVIVLHVPNPFFYIVSGIMTLYIGALFIRRFWPGKRQH